MDYFDSWNGNFLYDLSGGLTSLSWILCCIQVFFKFLWLVFGLLCSHFCYVSILLMFALVYMLTSSSNVLYGFRYVSEIEFIIMKWFATLWFLCLHFDVWFAYLNISANSWLFSVILYRCLKGWIFNYGEDLFTQDYWLHCIWGILIVSFSKVKTLWVLIRNCGLTCLSIYMAYKRINWLSVTFCISNTW